MDDDLKLCYVRGPWAWFTTRELSEQWGDDWNDALYEHNAGPPYERIGHEEGAWDIVKVAWDGWLEEPCERHLNSPWSVEQINAGAVAWLHSPSYEDANVVIPAGTTLPEFRRLVAEARGHVYEDRATQAERELREEQP